MKLAIEMIIRGSNHPSSTMKTETVYNDRAEGFHVSIGLGNISMPPRHGVSFVE